MAAAIAGLGLTGCGASSRPASLDRTGTFDGVPVGFTAQGYAYMGDPTAPVTIEEFSDFLCPFCGRHFERTLPTLVRDYVATGRVRYVFRDMPLVAVHPNAPQGHVAARCVAQQSPELFWTMHDELFSTQDRWRDLPDPTAYLAAAAKKAGADMDEYDRCVSAGAQTVWVERSVRTGMRKLGFDSTPTFRLLAGGKRWTLVGAYPLDTFQKWLAALLAGKPPPRLAHPEQAKLPYWASAAGLAPDPARPGFTKAGDPYRGALGAKVVVFEFANFQCPACRAHALETQPVIDRRFVDTGKVRWVFKNLLLKEYPQSLAAAAAAECAGDQGRFWQMHHLLFERQTQWARNPPDPELERLGAELGLDRARFHTCLDGRPAAERVLKDLYDAESVATASPTFVVLAGGRGSVVRGAPTVGKLSELIESRLGAANGRRQPGAAPRSRAAAAAKVELGTTDLAAGRNRVSFVVLDSRKRAVEMPTARVWLAGAPQTQTTARLEPVGDGERVYVARLDTPKPGTYRLLAEPVGAQGVQAVGTVRIRPKAAAPSVGDRAVPVRNPTVEDGTDPKTITTARPPDVELLQTSVAAALAAGRPFVVTFASPLYCRKRACGSVVDVVRSVARRWRGRGVDFVHVEVYDHNVVTRGSNRWVRAWHLPSNPFTYVVDRTGRIRTKLEGPFSAGELDEAVRAQSQPTESYSSLRAG